MLKDIQSSMIVIQSNITGALYSWSYLQSNFNSLVNTPLD